MLVIYHEYNQIVLSSLITLVSVQMIMTEIFTEVLILVLVLLTFMWLSNQQSKNLAAITGLCLGLVVLTRTQAIVFLVVFVLYFLYKLVKKEKILKHALIFVISFLMVIIPWMTRNLVRNGNFSLEDPKYVLAVVTTNGNNNVGSADNNQGSVFSELSSRVLNKGKFYVIRTTAFFTNGIINALFQFPFTLKTTDIKDYVSNSLSGYPLPYGKLSASQYIYLFLQAAIVLLGIIYATQKYGFRGLFPMLFNLFYMLSSAVLGYTGFRFNQPVDWIFILYWAVGAVVLLSIFVTRKIIYQTTAISKRRKGKYKLSVAVVCAVICVGLVFPVSELLIHKEASTLPNKDLLDKTLSGELSLPTSTELDQAGLVENGFMGEAGYGLYPVYFTNEQQWSKLRNIGITYRYSRYQLNWEQIANNNDVLYFILSSDNVKDVLMDKPIVPNSDIKNGFFFHNSEVYVFGCDKGDHIQAYYVQIKTDNVIYEIKSQLSIPASCEQ